MEDEVGQTVADSSGGAVRVVRVRKRRRHSPHKRPWYKSKRLKYRIEILGKMLLVVLLALAFTAIVYVLTVAEN